MLVIPLDIIIKTWTGALLGYALNKEISLEISRRVLKEGGGKGKKKKNGEIGERGEGNGHGRSVVERKLGV